MTGFSLRWYLQDADNTMLPPVTPWRWILRIFVLLFQVNFNIIGIQQARIFKKNLWNQINQKIVT